MKKKIVMLLVLACVVGCVKPKPKIEIWDGEAKVEDSKITLRPTPEGVLITAKYLSGSRGGEPAFGRKLIAKMTESATNYCHTIGRTTATGYGSQYSDRVVEKEGKRALEHTVTGGFGCRSKK